MNRFVDEALIEVSSGNGGGGAVHFRREKYVERGGPDGGDGGGGGDAVFIVKRNLKTLSRFKTCRIYRAENGSPGRGRRKHGKMGRDVEIPVPPGTILKEPQTGEIIKDLTGEKESWVFLKGGRGGKGNWHFRSSTRQAPRYAQPGKPGKTRNILIELNIIADIGMVGRPNAGKSTLLSVLTNAHPEIAGYPFTSKIPNLGVLSYYEQDIVLADIPGIIEGASRGAGLGLRFLKHINRTRILAFLIDLSNPSFSNTFEILKEELKNFSPELLKKPRILVGTKMDLDPALENLKLLAGTYSEERILGISALTGLGIARLKKTLADLAAENL